MIAIAVGIVAVVAVAVLIAGLCRAAADVRDLIAWQRGDSQQDDLFGDAEHLDRKAAT